MKQAKVPRALVQPFCLVLFRLIDVYGVLLPSMSIYYMLAWCPWRSEKNVRSPGTN